MLTRRFLALVPVVAVGLLLQGCGSMTHAKDAATAAITKFHSDLNSGAFDAIWNETDDAFRNVSKREQFQKLLDAVHRKLGRVTQTSTANWAIQNLNLHTVVVMVQKTQFEHGTATETFTYAAHDQTVKLRGYNIQSVDLITL